MTNINTAVAVPAAAGRPIVIQLSGALRAHFDAGGAGFIQFRESTTKPALPPGPWQAIRLSRDASAPGEPTYTAGDNIDISATNVIRVTGLETKQDVLTEAVTNSPYSGGLLPVELIGKSVLLYAYPGNKVVLPTPTMADLGKIVRIEAGSTTDQASELPVFFLESGSKNGTVPPHEFALASLLPRTSILCQVLLTARGTPYRDTVPAWLITGGDNSQATLQYGIAPIITATADGAQTIQLGRFWWDIISVTCLSAADQSVRTLWPTQYSRSGNSSLAIAASAGIKVGDSISVRYFYVPL